MVLSRALSFAAVTLVVGCCAVGQVEAQENLDAGKNPSQIFSGTCTACHKSARGLLKTVAPGSLQGFLRQHYTTSPEMAGALASYLMSNGATDTRYGDKQKGGKEGKDGKQTRSDAAPESRSEPKPESRPSAKPDSGTAQGETEHTGHKRLARPAEASPEAGKPAAEGQSPQATSERGPEGRKAKRLSKRGKPGLEEEAPKAAEPAEAVSGEPAKSDTARVEPAKPEPAKPEPARTESIRTESIKPETVPSEAAKPEEIAKPVESVKPVESAGPFESAKPVESPAQSASVNEALPPSLRRDPVPPVTPDAAPSAPPSVTASAPPPAPAEPAGPPEPPISR
jgi:hypothetical protein